MLRRCLAYLLVMAHKKCGTEKPDAGAGSVVLHPRGPPSCGNRQWPGSHVSRTAAVAATIWSFKTNLETGE
jgi:hypothetical protein